MIKCKNCGYVEPCTDKCNTKVDSAMRENLCELARRYSEWLDVHIQQKMSSVYYELLEQTVKEQQTKQCCAK